MRAFFDYFLTPLEGRGKAFPLAEPPCRMADGTDGATRKRSSCPSRPQRGTGLGSPIRVGQTGTRIANQSRKSMKRRGECRNIAAAEKRVERGTKELRKTAASKRRPFDAVRVLFC